MQKPLTVLLIAGLTVSACGWSDSWVNPTNWFGSSESSAVQAVEPTNPLIPAGAERRGIFDRPEEEDRSVPVLSVNEMRIEPAASGAILYATGIAARQGAFDVELRPQPSPENKEAGILAFSFRVVYPEYATPVGTERSRLLNEAVSLTRKDLAGIKLIRVEGQQNAQESRRR